MPKGMMEFSFLRAHISRTKNGDESGFAVVVDACGIGSEVGAGRFDPHGPLDESPPAKGRLSYHSVTSTAQLTRYFPCAMVIGHARPMDGFSDRLRRSANQIVHREIYFRSAAERIANRSERAKYTTTEARSSSERVLVLAVRHHGEQRGVIVLDAFSNGASDLVIGRNWRGQFQCLGNIGTRRSPGKTFRVGNPVRRFPCWSQYGAPCCVQSWPEWHISHPMVVTRYFPRATRSGCAFEPAGCRRRASSGR